MDSIDIGSDVLVDCLYISDTMHDLYSDQKPEAMMLIRDFKIGTEFMLNDKRYRCTDVGSRVVVAIRIDQVEVVRHNLISEGGGNTRRILPYEDADKDGWFNGPPYAVAEKVFDENDLPACVII